MPATSSSGNTHTPLNTPPLSSNKNDHHHHHSPVVVRRRRQSPRERERLKERETEREREKPAVRSIIQWSDQLSGRFMCLMVGMIFRRVSNSGQIRGFRFTSGGSVSRRWSRTAAVVRMLRQIFGVRWAN
ncbi:hypothetical protein HanRHA438_Chr10g0446281 [Helianthus annuus]|nr:hypothetical protein HanIR_Chr10g0468031 [Helianthus annuus]KAJ0878993.1 hypothetical protein HanRHA438_Chr10g0446281 [Helianthus annuus]